MTTTVVETGTQGREPVSPGLTIVQGRFWNGRRFVQTDLNLVFRSGRDLGLAGAATRDQVAAAAASSGLHRCPREVRTILHEHFQGVPFGIFFVDGGDSVTLLCSAEEGVSLEVLGEAWSYGVGSVWIWSKDTLPMDG